MEWTTYSEWTKNSVTRVLDQDILGCTKCDLCNYTINKTHGKLLGFGQRGNIMIVGLNPSYIRSAGRYNWVPEEGKDSESDKLFAKVLQEAEIPWWHLYITNVLKCSTPQNEDPTTDQVNVCVNSWLWQEIAMCGPTRIVCLGKKAYELVEPLKQPRSFRIDEVYHPAYIARDKNNYEKWLYQWQVIRQGN